MPYQSASRIAHLRDVDRATDPRVWAHALKAQWSIGAGVDELADWFCAAQDTAVAEALSGARQLRPPATNSAQLGFTMPADVLSLTIWDIKHESPDVVLLTIESDRDYAPREVSIEGETYRLDPDAEVYEELANPGQVRRYVRSDHPGVACPAAFVPFTPTSLPIDRTRALVIQPRDEAGVCRLCQATAGEQHTDLCPSVTAHGLAAEAYAAHQWDRGDG